MYVVWTSNLTLSLEFGLLTGCLDDSVQHQQQLRENVVNDPLNDVV